MPDIKTALQTALSKAAQQPALNNALLSDWDKDTADSKAQHGENKMTFTNNLTQDLFNYIRTNPGQKFGEIAQGLSRYKYNSVGSLLGQMAQQGLIRREGETFHYKYYAIAPSYVPLKHTRPQKSRAKVSKVVKQKELKTKQIAIVRREVKGSSPIVPSTAGLAALAKADQRQVSGNHYKDMPIQPWSVMESVLTKEEFVGFLKGNIIKYSMRAGRKEGSDDAGKAQHYQQKLDEVLRK